MTKLLQEAFERAQSLPEDAQDAIAQQLLDEIEDELRWDEQFARSGELLERLAEEAHEDYVAGRTEPLDPDTL
jgi:hypothetical protein